MNIHPLFHEERQETAEKVLGLVVLRFFGKDEKVPYRVEKRFGKKADSYTIWHFLLHY